MTILKQREGIIELLKHIIVKSKEKFKNQNHIKFTQIAKSILESLLVLFIDKYMIIK